MLAIIEEKLINSGYEIFLLEVLCNNQQAINAYQKAGFTITRTVDCFKITRPAKPVSFRSHPITFSITDRQLITDFAADYDWQPSWENDLTAILRIPDELVVILAALENDPVAITVYYPTLRWVMAHLVKLGFRRRGIGTMLLDELFNRLPPGHDTVKFLNIPVGELPLTGLVKKFGAEIIAGQFEMEKLLSQ